MVAEPASTASSPPTFSARVDAALTDMRSSAKWLLGAFAATGAVVFAGLQITSLGHVNSRAEPWRVPTAMLGFSLTVIGIGLAIGAVGHFLRRPPLTAKDLVHQSGADYAAARESVAHDATLLGSYESVDQVWRELTASTRAIQSPDDINAKAADALTQLLENALIRASIVMAGRRYSRALRLVACGAAVAAAGAGTFAVAVAQPEQKQALLPSVVRTLTPVTVSIRTNSPQRSKILAMLGTRCDLGRLSGVVLEQQSMDAFTVAVAASKDCHTGVLTLSGDDAVVSLAEAPAAKGG